MKKYIFYIVTIITALSSCNNDDNFTFSSEDTLTTLKIEIEDTNGQYVSGIPVYAYNESTWETYGDNPQFADFTATSGDEGLIEFLGLTTDTTFNEANNFIQTYVFSTHYTINGINKIKERTISFNIGDDKTATIILN